MLPSCKVPCILGIICVFTARLYNLATYGSHLEFGGHLGYVWLEIVFSFAHYGIIYFPVKFHDFKVISKGSCYSRLCYGGHLEFGGHLGFSDLALYPIFLRMV